MNLQWRESLGQADGREKHEMLQQLYTVRSVLPPSKRFGLVQCLARPTRLMR